ncbi:MAG: hypothetical protein ACLSB9_28070 [Hydrogeniiclostridium mannosilyticum]
MPFGNPGVWEGVSAECIVMKSRPLRRFDTLAAFAAGVALGAAESAAANRGEVEKWNRSNGMRLRMKISPLRWDEDTQTYVKITKA